jgi:hypothetical protein
MRVLVCGSRHFNDHKFMKDVLQKEFYSDDTVTLIHGDAKGADRLSEEVLKGYFHGGFEVLRFPADWDTYGKSAGPIRNTKMLKEGKPDMVIAFMAKDSRGTKNMVDQAESAGIPVRIIEI